MLLMLNAFFHNHVLCHETYLFIEVFNLIDFRYDESMLRRVCADRCLIYCMFYTICVTEQVSIVFE